MNVQAEKHLVRAEGFLARGDEWYGKAADEIIAAQEADLMLTVREIAERFDRSQKWVRLIVTWRTNGEPDSPIDWKRGSHATTAEIQAGAEKLLRDAPLEQVERIIEALPAKRQQAVKAAFGDEYAKARQIHDEHEANLSDAEKRRRRDAAEALTRDARQAAGGFAALGIVGHLEQAQEELQEMIDEGALVPRHTRQVETAYKAFGSTLEMAKALLAH